MREDIMSPRTALDVPDHLVQSRIDDGMHVAGIVALQHSYRDSLVGVEPFHLLSSERRSREHQPRQNRKHYGRSRAMHRHPRIGKVEGCHFCVRTVDASAPQGK